MSPSKGIILPIAYFPPVSYFICLASGSELLIETGETFPRQTLRNRCEIADSKGKQILVVPIHTPHGNPTRTHEVLLSGHFDWQQKHWKALQTAYSSSPYFIFYADRIRDLLFTSHTSLEEMDLTIIQGFLDLLKIPASFSVSHGYLKYTGEYTDLRMAFSKSRAWGAEFREYPQVFSHKTGFLEDLSILDLLFNLGPEASSYLQEAKAVIPGLS